MAIILMIPLTAKKEGFSILIPGKLKIPAKTAMPPMIIVVKCVKLFLVSPSTFIDFKELIFASKIKPVPIVSINKAST